MIRNLARIMIRAGATLFCLAALSFCGPLTAASRLVDLVALVVSALVFAVGVLVAAR